MTTDMVTPGNRCRSTSKSGTACRAYATKGSDVCYFHCYSVEGRATAQGSPVSAARSRGGRNSRKSVRLERQLSPRLRSLLSLIESAAAKVEAGQMSPAVGQSLSSLSNSLLRVYSVAEIELQLKHLESVAPIAPKRIVAPTGRKDITDALD